MPDETLDGDAEVVAGREPPSRRQPLDRARIVAAAISFIDEFGLPGLSMRRWAPCSAWRRCRCTGTSPAGRTCSTPSSAPIIDEMAVDEEVLDSPRHGWQDFLQRLAHGVRRVALAHPRAFPLVASRPTEAPWLRPPLRSLDTVESFLHGLVQEGFTDDAAVAAYRAFTSFLLGHLLLEVSTYGADVGPLDVIDDAEPRNERPLDHPTVERLSAALGEDHAAAEFEEALEDLLDRIALVQSESGPGGVAAPDPA